MHAKLAARAAELGASVDCRQSNHEGALCDWIRRGARVFRGDPAERRGPDAHVPRLFDALKGVGVPAIEVHISNPEAREPFRHVSRIAGACVGKVAGFGTDGYVLALEGLIRRLSRSA